MAPIGGKGVFVWACLTTCLMATFSSAALVDPVSLVWPDEAPIQYKYENGKSNSSQFLIDNHDRITKLRPRLLMINFHNRYTNQMVVDLGHELIRYLNMGSENHGYKSSTVAALDYQLLPIVNLRDPTGDPSKNGTLFPHTKLNGMRHFKFDQLFTDAFTNYLQLKDEQNHLMGLQEAIQQGYVHEIAFIATQNAEDISSEVIELKQKYDKQFNKLSGLYDREAGNGGTLPGDKPPWFGNSYRILFVNGDRGLGCAVHSLGHGMEQAFSRSNIPAIKVAWDEYTGLNFGRKYLAALPTFYYLPYKVGINTMEFLPQDMLHVFEPGIAVKPYVATCGNVHFPPNARRHYDYANVDTVKTTCENFWETEEQTEYSAANLITLSERVTKKDDDCGGRFQIWWRQNLPSVQLGPIKISHGIQVRNWWPYLFY